MNFLVFKNEVKQVQMQGFKIVPNAGQEQGTVIGFGGDSGIWPPNIPESMPWSLR